MAVGLLKKSLQYQGQTYSNEPGLVVLDGVSKRFRRRTISKSNYTTIKSVLLGRRGRVQAVMLEALRDLSVVVPPGSALGVIGRNGSGKSTLLKLISGIYHPDQGAVRAFGRISALIELGAGFHPEFSGRENVYLGGIMYGLSKKEIDARFDAIVRYAELDDVIDDPVRTYSSGMYMRLGFSLAVHTDPDILLIDEVLAVGDAGFIHRCQDTISEFRRRGKTLVFVTHDLTSVTRWCDEVIWLEKGTVRLRGEPRYVVDSYLQRVEEEEELLLEAHNSAQNEIQHGRAAEGAAPSSLEAKRWGNRDVEITEVRMLDARGQPRWLFHPEEPVSIEVRYRIQRPVPDLVFGIGLLRVDGLEVHGANTAIDDVLVPLPTPAQSSLPVEGVYRYHLRRLGLLENTYYLDVAAHTSEGMPFDYHHRLHTFSVRSGNMNYSGVYVPEHTWEVIAAYPVQERAAGAEQKAWGRNVRATASRGQG